MSTTALERFENVKQLVRLVEPDFNVLAKIHGAVNFEREASFALQLLQDNSYLADIAMSNQDSLKRAILNVAAIGLSLSPVHKLAYLVPRKKQICLDISYRGFVQLATDSGAIKFAMAEVVYERDTFQIQGIGKEPIHIRSPFAADRGEVVGAYCVAKTHDGDFLTTTMSAEEIISVRERSESFKSGKTNPWDTDRNEMIKKTVIRRAYKSWPMTDTRKRFDQAIDVSIQADPIDLTPPVATIAEPDKRAQGLAKIREMLVSLKRTEEKLVEHLVRMCRRNIKKLDELTENEISQAITFLTNVQDGQNAQKAKEAASENVG